MLVKTECIRGRILPTRAEANLALFEYFDGFYNPRRTGGLDVALALAGEPLWLRMPRVWGIRLDGDLPDWVSAKDVILELLRRHGVKGGVGRILEYHGPGLAGLTAMDRHVIANMGAELGATASVFFADERVREFLRAEDREAAYEPLAAQAGARYDLEDAIDLGSLVPLVAMPHSPGNVVTVLEASGVPLDQVVIGSSANPGLRDFAMAAAMVHGRRVAPGLSFDVNPTSRELLLDLTRMGATFDLVAAGARLHQAGCLGCIGMGQAPAAGQHSLRTFPRNFPGRSGTPDDNVWLCSPETAAASALSGAIEDPRAWAYREGVEPPQLDLPEHPTLVRATLEPPLQPYQSERVTLVRGPNISTLPELDPLPDSFDGPVLLKVGDDVSTDEISPAGAQALPYRSNLPKLADFTFTRIDPDYPARAREAGPHVVVGGENYGQGSSREHAAITPRLLGLQAVLAKSYARIHWQNLANFGVLPLEFTEPGDYDRIDPGDRLEITDLRTALSDGEGEIVVRNATKDEDYRLTHHLSPRQRRDVLAGGAIPAHAAAAPDHGAHTQAGAR
jgi:aconitate hydratase